MYISLKTVLNPYLRFGGVEQTAPLTLTLRSHASSQVQSRGTLVRSRWVSLSQGTLSEERDRSPDLARDRWLRGRILGKAWDWTSSNLTLSDRSTTLRSRLLWKAATWIWLEGRRYYWWRENLSCTSAGNSWWGKAAGACEVLWKSEDRGMRTCYRSGPASAAWLDWQALCWVQTPVCCYWGRGWSVSSGSWKRILISPSGNMKRGLASREMGKDSISDSWSWWDYCKTSPKMSFLGICLQLLLGLQSARIKMMTPSEISLNNVSHQVRVKHQYLQVVVSQEKLRV